jgi:hypothetical protein
MEMFVLCDRGPDPAEDEFQKAAVAKCVEPPTRLWDCPTPIADDG